MDRQKGHILDIRGGIIPINLLKASQVFRELKSGETMEILLADSDTRKNLFKVLPASLYQVIEIKETESVHRILLRKISSHKEKNPMQKYVKEKGHVKGHLEKDIP